MRVKKPRTTVVTPKNLLMAVMLMALHRSNSYGYKLMEETAAFWREAINRGTVYRTLRQMEKNGIIKSTWDINANRPARRMYSITDEGEAYLDLWIESLKQYQSNVEAFLKLYNRLPNRDE
jgi:PadR family transcriptional regulator PadR